MKPVAPQDTARQLCSACGLCCNGVLFADVRLKREEDPDDFRNAGFPIVQFRNSSRFMQPCPAFAGTACSQYAKRPLQCRRFECSLLKKVLAHEMTPASALKRIAIARRELATVESILEHLGCNQHSQSLGRRFSRAMRQPEDLAARASSFKGRLLKGMDRLMKRLHGEFLSLESADSKNAG